MLRVEHVSTQESGQSDEMGEEEGRSETSHGGSLHSARESIHRGNWLSCEMGYVCGTGESYARHKKYTASLIV
jgi:hypothetical protein